MINIRTYLDAWTSCKWKWKIFIINHLEDLLCWESGLWELHSCKTLNSPEKTWKDSERTKDITRYFVLTTNGSEGSSLNPAIMTIECTGGNFEIT